MPGQPGLALRMLVTPEARSAEDTETVGHRNLGQGDHVVTPEARSAEDTETALPLCGPPGPRALHQRLDPRRILKQVFGGFGCGEQLCYTRGSIRGGY